MGSDLFIDYLQISIDDPQRNEDSCDHKDDFPHCMPEVPGRSILHKCSFAYPSKCWEHH